MMYDPCFVGVGLFFPHFRQYISVGNFNKRDDLLVGDDDLDLDERFLRCVMLVGSC
jgi:hypothetical protein